MTRCWVREEALLKATGVGLAGDPTTVDVGDPDRAWVAPPSWVGADLSLPRAAAAVVTAPAGAQR